MYGTISESLISFLLHQLIAFLKSFCFVGNTSFVSCKLNDNNKTSLIPYLSCILRTDLPGEHFNEHSGPNTLSQHRESACAISRQHCTLLHNYSLSRRAAVVDTWVHNNARCLANECSLLHADCTHAPVSGECMCERLLFFTWSAWNSLRWWFIFTAQSVAVVAELFCRTLLSRARRRLRWLRTKIGAAINHLFIVARVQ